MSESNCNETENGESDLPLNEVILSKLQDLERRLEEKEKGELTRVNSMEESPDCPHCGIFDRVEGCRNGLVGIDPETRDVQADVFGVRSSYIICPSRLQYEQACLEQVVEEVSQDDIELPAPGKPVSVACNLDDIDFSIE